MYIYLLLDKKTHMKFIFHDSRPSKKWNYIPKNPWKNMNLMKWGWFDIIIKLLIFLKI